MYFIYIFIGILVILPLAQYLMLVIKLYGTQLTPAKFKPLLSSIKVPEATQQQLAHAQKSLEALGFEFFNHIVNQDIITTSKPNVQLLMHHPEQRCYALVANPHNPDLSRPYSLKFQSFTNHLTIEAMDADAEGVIKSFEPLHAFNLESNQHQEAFNEFLSVRGGLTANSNHLICFQDAESYSQHMQKIYAQYLRFLYQQGLLKKNKNNLQMRFSTAAKLAWQMFMNKKKTRILTAEETTEAIKSYSFLPHAQAQAHRRVQNNQQSSQLGRWGKTLLFFGSAMVFALLFGIAWSPFLVLILIPVLLFHELGHYWAMKLFGYRDLQILFLPIGAMVSGNKQQPSPMQRTLVSLAGPVPGLLLAFGLTMWAPDFIISEYGLSLVFMLLIINYLNLLPFMPLDGGHVVNLLLFDRWPFLQFLLMLISVLIFALGAWAWSDPILTFLAVIFGLGLKNNFQQAQHVTQARQRWGNKLKNRDNLNVIYHMMKQSPAPFNNKYQDATPINERLSHPSPSVRDSLLGMVMYLTALLAPLVVIQQVIGLDLIKFIFSSDTSSFQYDADENQQWDPSYWQQQFNLALTPTEKQSVVNDALLMYQESEDFYLLSEIYPQAIKLFETNQWQENPDYPVLLRANLLYQISEQPEYDAQTELNKLSMLLGENSIAYTEVLVNVLTWQHSPDNKDQLIGRLAQLESHQKYQTLFNALAHLQFSYEQDQQIGAYESLLVEYLPIFKSKAPDLYPSLLQYHYQALFAQQKYQKLLDLAQQNLQSRSTESTYSETIQYEMLAWVALLDHQYELAQTYQSLRQTAEQAQQQELKKEMGFLAGLVLSEQVNAISLNQDPLFKLALAIQKDQPSAVASELDTYIQYVQGWRKQPFSEHLKQIKHFDDNESKQLNHIKYQFLFRAIRATQPDLLNEISDL
ncbi:site-2 protease family protein [Marinicella litoralis]|uniref:Zn-dependent protease n=1 Tax=Marinicella litoralis TaxID=644220 RepID=A0A4R6XGJ3_9GAMM|nr:site-2 protease family protein [Marinicella litoralis]TDR16864.1 Zn-dependent protease [Marinicella litoralis]